MSNLAWRFAPWLLLIVSLAAFGLWLTRPAPVQAPEPTPEEQCITFQSFVPDQQAGMLRIGEGQLCGVGLHWSATYGPSWEAWQQSNAK